MTCSRRRRRPRPSHFLPPSLPRLHTFIKSSNVPRGRLTPLPLLQFQVHFLPNSRDIHRLSPVQRDRRRNSQLRIRNLGSPPHPPFNYSSAVPILLAAPSLFQVSGDHVGWDRQNAHPDCPWTRHTSLPPSKPFYSFLPQIG